MTSRKGPVFRVTGLPAEMSDEELDVVLRTTIRESLLEDETKRIRFNTTIIPSCYDDLERAALVEFHYGVPSFLNELVADPLGDWQVAMGDIDINFDKHFFGFTQLYKPEANLPVTADIIAITGLDGHAYGSWRGKGNLGRMWLRDFLSKDLPHCRTMIYGYNSKLSSHGIDTIMDYGRELMEELKKVRNSDELRQRPLFFVAHSFGGIILAHCLVKAVQANEDDHPTIATLHKATYGMLLFAIPHKGLVVSDIQNMVTGGGEHPRSKLLEQIKVKSDLLAHQLVDFKNLIRDRKIVSFYETGQTRQLELNVQTKRWERTGSFVTAVDTDSALLQLPDSMEEKIPLSTDHSMIVKFDTRQSQGYTSSRDKLKSFEKDAAKVVGDRFLTRNKGFKELVNSCLKSLVFTETRNRFYGIDRAAKGTCEWLLQHEVYRSWISCPSDFLWIKGIPGCGKSTVLQYALDNYQKTPEARDGALVLAFFFHRRGDDLQQTSSGFIRSILCQILRQYPNTLQDLIDVFSQKSNEIGRHGESWQWRRDELWRFFEDSLKRILKARQIWVFVDALDECRSNDAKEVFRRFRSLLRNVPHAGLHRFQVCFSSRRFPDMDPKGKLVINLDWENQRDISTYVRQQLSHVDGLEHSGIPTLIINNAKSLFLWASIMVGKVLDKLAVTDSWSSIKYEIRHTPHELDDLYHHLIKDPQPGFLDMIRWICFASRPLLVDELRWAMSVDVDYEFKSLQDCRTSRYFGPDDVRFEERVRLISHGLAEVIPQTKVVRFIHQSVKDFLIDKRGLESVIPNTRIDIIIHDGHYRLSRACIRYFAMRELAQLPSHCFSDIASTLPFLDYAVKSWISHLKLCDAESQTRILRRSFGSQKGLLQTWTRVFSIIDQHSRDRPPRGTTMLHLLSENQLVAPLRQLLAETDCTTEAVNATDEHGQTPLLCAARSGSFDATKLLLDSGSANLNVGDTQCRTPLWWAAKNGHTDVTELLLCTNGINVNVRDVESGRTPLAWAARNGHHQVTKLILRTDEADVNAKDTDYGRTPLTWAARNGHAKVAALILRWNDVDVQSKDNASRLPIAWAAKNGHIEVLKLLLESSLDTINTKDDDGHTPLSWAAKNGHIDVVELLLRIVQQNGADIDTVDEDGRTPLSWAAGNGHSRVVDLILNMSGAGDHHINHDGHGPLFRGRNTRRRGILQQDTSRNSRGYDVNSKDRLGRTPLAWAAHNGHAETVRLLLEVKAKINTKDRHGRTPLSIAVGKYKRMAERFLHVDKTYASAEDEEPQTSLLLASENDHYTVAKLLLESKNIDVNTEGQDGWTPLLWAVKNGRGSMVKLLLDTGKADVNKRTDDDWIPLSLAADNGHTSVVKSLIESNADVNAKNLKGWTPLLYASVSGHDSVVKLLLERNADVDLKDPQGWTPLLWASEKGYHRVVKHLLYRNADVNVRTDRGWSPLICATTGGHDAVMKLLLKRNAHVDVKDQKDRTPLLLAATKGYDAAVELLLKRNADANMRTNGGWSPLLCASNEGHTAVTKLLLERREVDANAKEQNGRTSLLLAAANGYDEVVELLLKRREVDVNEKDQKGRTPLLLASANGYDAVVELLLERREAHVDEKDHEGKTPLLWASEKGFARIVDLLLSTGKAQVEARDAQGKTPLLQAVEGGYSYVTKLLLKKGKADVNATDGDGWTALLIVAKNCRKGILKLILDTKKAQINFKDNKGRTPLLWAAKFGYTALVKLLLKQKNIDTEARDSIYGRTPLIWAAQNGRRTVVKVLLESRKVDINAEDHDKLTPLSWAARNGRGDVVKMLVLDEKIDLEKKDIYHGRTPLIWAAYNGRNDVVKSLLAADTINVNAKDGEERTPLAWAVIKNRKTVTETLLSLDTVDIYSKDTYGRTPLSLAANGRYDIFSLAPLLLNKGQDKIDERDHKGRTPLFWAVRHENQFMVDLLLDTKLVDVNAKDHHDQTPLCRAVQKWDLGIVKALIHAKDIDIESKERGGQTPLSWSAREDKYEVMELLLGTGKADVNTQDNCGRTPLIWAAREDCTRAIKLLLKTKQVDTTVTDRDGLTALAWATRKGHRVSVKLLSNALSHRR